MSEGLKSPAYMLVKCDDKVWDDYHSVIGKIDIVKSATKTHGQYDMIVELYRGIPVIRRNVLRDEISEMNGVRKVIVLGPAGESVNMPSEAYRSFKKAKDSDPI